MKNIATAGSKIPLKDENMVIHNTHYTIPNLFEFDD